MAVQPSLFDWCQSHRSGVSRTHRKQEEKKCSNHSNKGFVHGGKIAFLIPRRRAEESIFQTLEPAGPDSRFFPRFGKKEPEVSKL
jgi:hypothetical protein